MNRQWAVGAVLLLAAAFPTISTADASLGPATSELLPFSSAIHKAKEEREARIPGQYIVVLEDSIAHPGAVAETQTDRYSGRLGLVYRHALNGYSAKLSKGAVKSLRKNPRVKSVTPDYEVETFAQSIPEGIQRTFATENDTADIDGVDKKVNVDVAVIDTGVDFKHPDLNVFKRTNCVPAGEDLETESGVEECVDNSGVDGAGHGTHVAGTIGAIDNGAGVVGVAPGARLWGVRVLNSKGSGSFSWIIAGIDWVTAHSSEIEVANMSLGCSGWWCYSPPLEEAIDASVEAGVVYVVAAGNEGEDASNAIPASYPDVITVSALADYDGEPGGKGGFTCRSDAGSDDTMATFSNYGKNVDIAAPGVCIDSALPVDGSTAGTEYGALSGTSMAAPHVAGAAALLASVSNPNSKEDTEEIRDQLVDQASLAFRQTAPSPPAPLLYLSADPLTSTEVATGGVEDLGAMHVVVTGGIAPRGPATEYKFEYGLDGSYGKTIPVPSKSISAGASFTRVSESLTSLIPSTTYHYRLVATNNTGTFQGDDHTFTTYALAYTLGATDVDHDGATLHGALYLNEWPGGVSTTYQFEYGLTPAYGNTVNAQVDDKKSEESQIIYGSAYDHAFASLPKLANATTYHYRLVAKNSKGTFYGADERLRTTPWMRFSQPKQFEPPDEYDLAALSCTSSTFCLAVAREEPYAELWSDELWYVQQRPEKDAQGRKIKLDDISCSSETSCVAVGWVGTCAGIECPDQVEPRVLRWDSGKWTTESVPLPEEALAGDLAGVSCTSPTACMAVGTFYLPWYSEGPGDEDAMRPGYFAAQWDGKAWSLLSMPEAPFGAWMPLVSLNDVSCVSTSACFAVGSETMRWDGSKWSRQSIPGGEDMTAVSCFSASACMAVGFQGVYASAQRWDGSEWTTAPVGEIGKAGWETYLTDVSCTAVWSCAAVGRSTFIGTNAPIAARWDGTEWAMETAPLGSSEARGRLNSVSCVSPVHCTAAGEESGEGSLIETYDYGVAAPTASTKSATGLLSRSATLNGTLNGGSLPSNYQFEYVDHAEFVKNGYANATKAPVAAAPAGSSASDITVSRQIVGLVSSTTYHFRLSVANPEGSAKGKDETFTTPHLPRFEAESYPTTLGGGGALSLITPAGTFSCGSTTLESALSAQSKTLTFNPTATGCKHSAGPNVTFNPKSCHFTLDALNAGPPYKGALGVACDIPGEGIVLSAIISGSTWCKVTIWPQQGLTGVDLANVGTGAERAVSLDAALTGVDYELKGGCIGNPPQQRTDGVMSGDMEIEAEGQTGTYLSGQGLPFGTYMAGKASAVEAEQPRFEAEAYPLAIGGPGALALITPAGTFSCGSTTLESALSAQSKTLTFNPTATGCKHSAGPNVTFNPKSCHFTLDALNAGPPYKGALGVACDTPNDGIVLSAIITGNTWCKVTIWPQQGLTGVDLANVGTGAERAVSLDAALTGVDYELKGGCIGNPPQQRTDGTMSGEATLEGVE